ncbi:hypothetical protein [Shewanella sp. 10N.286.54.B9]|uniref:hypothetical protein n=1 Tax=Shewanella sp. 10N.286.54.B9 TaxID=3229719 RepID=UPI00354FE18C
MTKKHDATDSNFRQSVKQYVEAQQLSEQALTRMQALLMSAGANTDESKVEALLEESYRAAKQPLQTEPDADSVEDASLLANTSQTRKPIIKLIYALAASVFVLVAAFQLYSYNQMQQLINSGSNKLVMTSISWKIADEVARNHVKMKPLEVQTQQLTQLRDYFSQLDFTPVNSSFLTNSGDNDSKMLGGRYCSIQGLTAAQIRFSQKDKQPITLYEVQYDPSLYGKQPILEQGDKPTELIVRGVAVSIWVEKGLLMATARSID